MSVNYGYNSIKHQVKSHVDSSIPIIGSSVSGSPTQGGAVEHGMGPGEAPWATKDFSLALQALLRNEDFQRFMQEEPYCYESGARRGLPAGLSADLAEELVVFARRMRGMPLLGATDEGTHTAWVPSSFWVVSPAMNRDLFGLVAQAEKTSNLWHALEPLLHRREIVDLWVHDLTAAVMRDGIPLGRDAVEAVAQGDRPPANLQEELLANVVALLQSDEDLIGPIDGPQALKALWERMAAGFEGVPSYPRYRMPVSEMLGDPGWLPPTLEGLWAHLERLGQREIHPVLDIIFVSDLMFDAGPFPRLNGLMEVVLRHGLARYLGMPALEWVPLSSIRLDWEMGINPQLYRRPYGQAVTPGPFGSDSTLALRENIGFLRRGLAELEAAVSALQARDNHWRANIEADWRLNGRQKELLSDLVGHPAQEVDALGYEKRFGVAMSTAHNDLGSLARLGLLRAQTVGRKQVYRLEVAAFGG